MPAELSSRPLRVLLIEDNPDDGFLLERYLRRNGFAPQIERVETASEMLASLAGEAPDLVLADYNLPNFSGPAALQILRASGLDIPFIMLSGAMSEATAVESMRAGAQDYVTKQNLTRLVPAVERELKEVSDRRKTRAAELALQASEDRFHRLVEAMPLGLLISDAEGSVIYANSAAAQLLEFSSADLSPHGPGAIRLATLCPPLADRAVLLQAAAQTSEPFEGTCVTTSGQTIEVLIGVAVLNPDAPVQERQLAAFVADLTLQKKSEQILRRTEKLAVAGRLAASIAHEINNPLEAITNLLYLLAGSTLEPDAREYLNLAQSELNRVAQITVQTLRFHRRSTRPIHASLEELIGIVLPLFESRLRQCGASVHSRFRTVPRILVHDGEIRQVITNLVGNAIDAMVEGGCLYLRIGPARRGGDGEPGVALTVADTGSGMSPETLARIFEPFFSTKGITGTGLGLWVSSDIIHRHQGYLRVRTRQAAGGCPGSVFRLFLPLSCAPVDPPGRDPATPSVDSAHTA